jgi:hypothetical protein
MPISTFIRGRPANPPRGLQFLALTETAMIQTPISVDDGGGGASQIWQTSGTANCRIYPVSSRAMSRVIGGAISERSTHYIEAVLGTQVALVDRVVIPARGTFEVTAVLERTSALTTVFEVFQAQ